MQGVRRMKRKQMLLFHPVPNNVEVSGHGHGHVSHMVY